MERNFFEQKHCDRCGADLGGCRTMSWFTTETICMDCCVKEDAIKKALRARGDVSAMEGCGYVPEMVPIV